ncbi:MAG: class I SAM-dependent methyltransferase [Candidatus Neomarinimicrobiota bacterium]
MRLRYLADCIIKEFSQNNAQSLNDLVKEQKFKTLSIFQAQSEGPLNTYLKKCDNYVCSEFFIKREPGAIYQGIRNEDLQNLSFNDETFDLLIHTSVLEHIRKPKLALKEQYRVLKPGGILLFEVPLVDPWNSAIRTNSVIRVDTAFNADKFILDPVYHGDPQRKKGALVYTDWGLDIIEELEITGFNISYSSIRLNNSMMGHIVVFKCIK